MSNKPRKKKSSNNNSVPQRNRSSANGNSGVVSAQVTTEESFSGPIPSPDVLFRYDQYLPGLADRIVTMAESEAAHRHSMESDMLAGDIALKKMAFTERRFGQIFGFILSVLAIGGGVLLAINGVTGWGALLSLSGVAALAGVFVLAHKNAKD